MSGGARVGERSFREACRCGREGVIAKRTAGAYLGRRSRDRLEIKCSSAQKPVIGGYTQARGSRSEFGAPLLGCCEHKTLRYAGKVGSGLSGRTLTDLGGRPRSLQRARTPFADPSAGANADVLWVEPELVALAAFSELARAGRLRQWRDLGPREEKPAHEVLRERPR